MGAETLGEPSAPIIEDDDKLPFIYSGALRQAGFDTRVTPAGAEALTQLQTCQPAVIILDLHLPHVSGDKTLGAIRQMESRRRHERASPRPMRFQPKHRVGKAIKF